MKRLFNFTMAIIIALIAPVIQVNAKEIGQMNKEYFHIYVSSNADSQKADGTKSKPFADIDSAREYVRSIDKTHGDIIVEIADGTYYIDKAIDFNFKDSGSDKCTVKYVAAKGAHPVISAGKEIDGKWRNEGNGIYSVEYNRNRKLRSLYVNNQRRYMTKAELKGKGAYGKTEIKEGQADWAWTSGSANTGVLFNKNSIPLDTRNADDIELMTKTTWNTSIVCVKSLENKGLKLGAKLQMPYGAIAQTPGWGNAYQFKDTNIVYNVFEWLDEPGEFYFDKAEKRLYYYPKSDENINSISVVAPEVDTIINLKGDNLKNRVSNISFEGLEFAHTDWNLCQVDSSFGRATNQGATVLLNYDDVDWHGAIYRAYDIAPAAIQISSANNILFKNNTIIHTGNEGLSMTNDVSDIEVSANIFFDIGGSGILIGHPQHMYIGDKNGSDGRLSEKEKYDADEEGVCKNLTITNNLIKSTSRLFWGDSAVMVFVCQNMLFQYNQVEDTTYSGISLGWGWWNFDGSNDSVVPNKPTSTTKGNKILNNRFINTITVLADAGAIYTLGDMPDTVISENYIKHIGTDGAKADYHIRGIHIDEGTKHVFGEKNVIDINPNFAAIDCGDWGYKGDNVWDNNYSTSDIYKTTDDYEPNTKMTNKHTVPDAKWDEAALSIINASGIQSDHTDILSSDYYSLVQYNLPYIPKPQQLVPSMVASIATAILTISSLTTKLMSVQKKRKTK